MFTPLAVTISFALMGSLILSLTIIPVLASLLMRAGAEGDGRVLTALKRVYLPIMRWGLRYRKTAVSVALAALVATTPVFLGLGKEFMPIMDEGTTVIIIEKLPSISLERSLELDEPYQKAMMELPEVIGVAARIVFPVNNSSLIRSKIRTLASTAIPIVSIKPAIPGRVNVA